MITTKYDISSLFRRYLQNTGCERCFSLGPKKNISMHFVATFSLLLRIIVTYASVTYNGHYLRGSLYWRIFELDWMGCLQVCYNEPRCISYNYHKNKKICEINSDGIRECTSKQTIFSGEWIFHQIRVSVFMLFFLFLFEDICQSEAPSNRVHEHYLRILRYRSAAFQFFGTRC